MIAAGHSWGAWVAMVAAQDPGFSADVLLLSAPNTFGARIWTKATITPDKEGRGRKHLLSGKGERPNPNFRMVLAKFGPTLKPVKTPTVLILPDDNEWDPDPAARGEIAEKHSAG